MEQEDEEEVGEEQQGVVERREGRPQGGGQRERKRSSLIYRVFFAVFGRGVTRKQASHRRSECAVCCRGSTASLWSWARAAVARS